MSVRVCRPKLVFKNLCLSLVVDVPPLLFRTTPLSVSLLVTTVSLAKTDEPIKIVPFRGEWGADLRAPKKPTTPVSGGCTLTRSMRHTTTKYIFFDYIIINIFSVVNILTLCMLINLNISYKIKPQLYSWIKSPVE